MSPYLCIFHRFVLMVFRMRSQNDKVCLTYWERVVWMCSLRCFIGISGEIPAAPPHFGSNSYSCFHSWTGFGGCCWLARLWLARLRIERITITIKLCSEIGWNLLDKTAETGIRASGTVPSGQLPSEGDVWWGLWFVQQAFQVISMHQQQHPNMCGPT